MSFPMVNAYFWWYWAVVGLSPAATAPSLVLSGFGRPEFVRVGRCGCSPPDRG